MKEITVKAVESAIEKGLISVHALYSDESERLCVSIGSSIFDLPIGCRTRSDAAEAVVRILDKIKMRHPATYIETSLVIFPEQSRIAAVG